MKLGKKRYCKVFDEQLGRTFDGKTGAPGINTRLIVALYYLKYYYNLSDEAVVARWLEKSLLAALYWSSFSNMNFRLIS